AGPNPVAQAKVDVPPRRRPGGGLHVPGLIRGQAAAFQSRRPFHFLSEMIACHQRSFEGRACLRFLYERLDVNPRRVPVVTVIARETDGVGGLGASFPPFHAAAKILGTENKWPAMLREHPIR